jgi:tetratricopeptide (TPR) repeat protein
MDEAAWTALSHAQRGRAVAEEATAVVNLGIATMFGPRPAPDAEARFNELLAGPETNRFATASLLATRAHTRALLGRFSEARRDAATARAYFADFGMDVALASWRMAFSEVERLAGSLERAEEELRVASKVLEEAKLISYFSTAAAMCARVVFDRGAADGEVEHFLDMAEAAASSDDSATLVLANSTRGRMLARAGKADEGRELALAAVARVRELDAFTWHGDALLALAEVDEIAGRVDEAQRLRRRALELFEAKGDEPSSARARALLGVPIKQD